MFNLTTLLLSLTPLAIYSFLLLWSQLGLLTSPLLWETEYDYVIIGGGTAGCVLANRLSEDPNVQVLLLESGGYESPVTDTPILAPVIQQSAIDWAFRSVPQANCCTVVDGQSIPLCQGKVLGGSSVLNFMMYVRGNGRDYQDWVDSGALGWSYWENLPYFVAIEDMSIRKLSNSSYHGQGGPLKLSAANHISAIGPAFVASGRHLGYCIGDYNGEKPNVFSLSQTTTRRGARQSAAKSYLDPIAYRSNLKVLTYATARKITFDSSLRADSVIFNRLLSDHKVFARKEIILSAGALQSPKLLMQSGIGPRDHLDDLKIHVVNDLAGVGQNLQDHPTVGGMVFLINASVSLSDKRASSPLSVADYLTSGSGPLSSTIIEATGFINRKLGPSHPWPSVQLILMSSSFLSSQEGFLFRRVYGLTAELWSHYEPHFGRDSFMIFPVLLRPRSRGTVKLNSWNWRDSPRVDVNFYSDPEDLEDIVDAMEFVLELTKAPPLARLNPTWLNISMPGCEEFMAPSREYLRCTARAMTLTFWHFSGTCKMGSASDKMAVVDPDLQVIGVKGLRVVDASVMPNIVSGNTQATVYMIAERAADKIKGHRLEPLDLPNGDL